MTVGSLFSGIGGIDLGFIQAGHEISWAIEIDLDACKTYHCNFPDTKLINNDIRKVNPNELERVDILTAGFPCQPFSVCGKQKGFEDNRGNLFFEIMRFVDDIQPEIVFLENVANLTKHDNGRTFNIIYNELASRDYYIRYLVADACEYGIPQHRTRTYILAFRDYEQCQNYRFPEKVRLTKHIFDVIDKSAKVDSSFYLPENTPNYQRMAKAIIDDNQIYRFSDYGIQASKEGISFTLKANMGTWYNREPIIKDNYGIRKLTPQECLLLMGFPKEFTFPNIPLKNAYKQVGNSVCVPVVKAVIHNPQ